MRLADLRGRSVAVWGTGREGRAAVTAIAAHGPSRLIAVDDSANFLVGAVGGRAGRRWPRWPAATTRFAALVTADVVVRSPGVPQTHPWMAELRARGRHGHRRQRAVDGRPRRAGPSGVTGSKGKSTTVQP